MLPPHFFRQLFGRSRTAIKFRGTVSSDGRKPGTDRILFAKRVKLVVSGQENFLDNVPNIRYISSNASRSPERIRSISNASVVALSVAVAEPKTNIFRAISISDILED
jgi:hypothetical protein